MKKKSRHASDACKINTDMKADSLMLLDKKWTNNMTLY